jgi:hypothetical protein
MSCLFLLDLVSSQALKALCPAIQRDRFVRCNSTCNLLAVQGNAKKKGLTPAPISVHTWVHGKRVEFCLQDWRAPTIREPAQ